MKSHEKFKHFTHSSNSLDNITVLLSNSEKKYGLPTRHKYYRKKNTRMDLSLYTPRRHVACQNSIHLYGLLVSLIFSVGF